MALNSILHRDYVYLPVYLFIPSFFNEGFKAHYLNTINIKAEN